MVQTRSAAKRVESGQVHANDGVLTKDTTVKLASGDGVPSPAKKPRREDAAAPKKRRRGKPGELCQLNLDVLFLVRAFSSFRPFADERGGTRLPHTSTL